MSEKRMFAKTIVLSDDFLDMPMSARCLYFTLGMLGDDDGFVNSPKSIMRQCGASQDDLNILLAKKYLLAFENGLIVIKHWRINNYLRNDRYTHTKYVDEFSQLAIESNGSYSKNKVEKIENIEIKLLSREPKNDIEKVEQAYLNNYKHLFETGVVQTENPVINWGQSRKLTKDCIEKYGLENVLKAVEKSLDSTFCIEKGYVLTTILSAGVFAGLINGKEKGSVIAQTGVNKVSKSDLEEIEF